jgi:hypothetical protein
MDLLERLRVAYSTCVAVDQSVSLLVGERRCVFFFSKTA